MSNMRRAQDKYKILNKRAGRCVTCGAKRNRSKVWCDKHLDLEMTNKKARREAKRKEGGAELTSK